MDSRSSTAGEKRRNSALANCVRKKGRDTANRMVLCKLLESAGLVCVCVWWMPDLICWQFSFLETMMLKAPAETCARNEKFEQQLELAGADGPCACGPRAHACVLGRVQVCTSAWCSPPVRMEDY